MNSFVVILLWVLRRWGLWDDSPACWWRSLFWQTTRWTRRCRCENITGGLQGLEAQLLHCTREWYSSHWARRSCAGRTRKLPRSSSSWDAAVNSQETSKIHADTYSNDKIHCQTPALAPAQKLSNWTPLRTCAITMATSKQTSVSEIPATRKNPGGWHHVTLDLDWGAASFSSSNLTRKPYAFF